MHTTPACRYNYQKLQAMQANAAPLQPVKSDQQLSESAPLKGDVEKP